MNQHASLASKGSASVSLHGESIIICRLEGLCDGPLIRKSMQDTKHLVNEIVRKGYKPRLLIDISKITSQTSQARSEAKQLHTFGLERIAVCGGGRALTTVGRYIAKAGGMGSYTKFFRTEYQAQRWLASAPQKKHTEEKGQVLRRTIAVAIAAIGLSVLVGWATDNQFLKSWIPGGNAMNPMNAANFIVMAGVFWVLHKGRLGRSVRIITAVMAIWFVAWGALIALRNTFGWDLPIDRILFTSKIQFTNSVAPNTSLDYMLMGGLLLTILSGMQRMWHRYVFHTLSVILVITTLGAIFGMSFGLEQLYSGNYVPMAFNTAIVFLLFNHALQLVTIPLPFFAKIMQSLEKYWQPILVFVALLCIVGFAWQQSTQDVQRAHNSAVQEEFRRVRGAVTDRFSAYANALRGYKGFFEASQDVDVREYQNYFTSSQPEGGYPGLAAISFIRYIPRESEAAYIQEMRGQTNLSPAFANFGIYPKTSNEVLYPLTYLEPTTSNTTSWGFDLGTNEPRKITLESARDTGQLSVSGELNLNASNPSAPKRTGFFMSIPIYKNGNGIPTTTEERRSKIYGFINTVFDNNVVFPPLLDKLINEKVKVVITNSKDSSTLYVHNAAVKDLAGETKAEDSITLGGQTWKISLYTSDHFGSDGFARLTPYFVLIGGGVLATLAFAFLMEQIRRREQALSLADDMTEDLQNERNAAVIARQKDEAILASIGDAVFAVDSRGKILLFNPAAVAISGFSMQEAIGKPYKDILRFIYEKDHSSNDAFIKKALSGQAAAMQNHTKLIRKDGSEVYVADSAAPIRDHANKVIGAIVVFRDVTKDQELDRAKTEFVSLASHQLRTPLSAINWYGELLLSGDAGKLTEDQREYIQEIHSGNQRMIDLVNSLLDVSRLDLGKLSNQAAYNDVAALVKDIQKELAASISSKALQVRTEISHIDAVVADPKLIRMLVQNLLSNAVKYTPDKGSVTIVLRSASSQDMRAAALQGKPASFLYMQISDTGYGIPKAQQDKIFTKLFRADNVRSLDEEGTGLGLYIVKEVVDRLGGRVWFESIESVGTTFYILLPFHTKITKSNEKHET